MKKLFLLCLVAAAAAFASCSKEKGENSASIVGRWSIYQEIWEHDGQTIIEDYAKYGIRHIYVFNADGTGQDIFSEYEDGEWYTDDISFTYTLHGNKLYISEEDDEYADTFIIEKLTANELVFIDMMDELDGKMVVNRCFLRRI